MSKNAVRATTWPASHTAWSRAGENSATTWVGIFASFPQYRGREDAVSTTEERIKGNMPSGITHLNTVLTDEQAFGVAAFINSQPRPARANTKSDFPVRKNKPVDAAFAP